MPTVKELRKARGLSQVRLAEKANLTELTIWNIEHGKPVLRSTLVLVALALEVKPGEITGVNVVNPPKGEVA